MEKLGLACTHVATLFHNRKKSKDITKKERKSETNNTHIHTEMNQQVCAKEEEEEKKTPSHLQLTGFPSKCYSFCIPPSASSRVDGRSPTLGLSSRTTQSPGTRAPGSIRTEPNGRAPRRSRSRQSRFGLVAEEIDEEEREERRSLRLGLEKKVSSLSFLL